MDAVIKNPYFKLPANNITPSTLEKFSLEKIKSNIKADALFLYSLIRKTSGVKKVNTVDSDKICPLLSHYQQKAEKIASFDIVRGRVRKEMFIFNIPRVKTIPPTNSIPTRIQVKVVTAMTLIPTLI